jgi:hypothetical protein
MCPDPELSEYILYLQYLDHSLRSGHRFFRCKISYSSDVKDAADDYG